MGWDPDLGGHRTAPRSGAGRRGRGPAGLCRRLVDQPLRPSRTRSQAFSCREVLLDATVGEGFRACGRCLPAGV